MTSITAILSRSTSPPLSQRPCPGARTKLVALPNLSVNSCRSSSKRVCVTGWPCPFSWAGGFVRGVMPGS